MIPPNPVTGRVDEPDILELVLTKSPNLPISEVTFRHMIKNPSDAAALVASMDIAPAPVAFLTAFDYKSLAKTIKRGTHWFMDLMRIASSDSFGNFVPDGFPGSRPVFTIHCFNEDPTGTLQEGFRLVYDCKSLPIDEDVLRYVLTCSST
jgi:hypothetical protein